MKYNKFLKFIVCFTLAVLIFNFTLVSAQEETTVTIDPTPAPVEPAPTPEPVTVEEPAPPTITVENSVPPVQSVEVITPAEPLTENPAETAATPERVTTEPIIFDFSQPTETTTPETVVNDPVNNVAGASESVGGSGPILHEFITEIVRDANIKQLTILAQWQMSNEKAEGKYLGTDNSPEAGAQFLPSGQFEISKPVTVCALVADTGGINDINNISAMVNYPEAIAKAINQAGDASAGSAQVKSGCGQLKSQFNLEKLDPLDAVTLVCDKLRNNNNNLLSWGSDKTDNLVYSYEHLCGQEGILAKQAAELYCAEMPLSYDDPAGDYPVKISAKNNSGAEVTGENYLKYLELTTFENDFSEILYGPVKLNELKILEGDLAWGEATQPTVRNTGNTRLQIKIWQNDFGLGKTGDIWNLSYQAKVGTSTNFIGYAPDQTTALNGIIELGQSASMDFSVLINKFPDSDSAYWGKMTLSADKVPALSCQ